MNFSTRVERLSPLRKLALWALAVALLAGVVECFARAAGLELTIFAKRGGGSTAVILIALGTLLGMMAVESRPMADYGLIADARWRRRAMRGAALGVAFYLAYFAHACGAGLFSLHPENVEPTRWAKAVASAWSAGVIAVVQQIIFSGYLLTTLRDRHHRLVAVLLPALLFGLAGGAATTEGLLGGPGQRTFLALALIQTLLGTLRLRTGSIVFPAGLLAGCIAVRKVISKSHVLEVDWKHDQLMWLAPEGDPRQGTLMAWLLAGVVVGAAVMLIRFGEQTIKVDAGVDASFKRYMPFSNLFGLATLDRWATLLWQSRGRVGLAYLPRLSVSLFGSALFTLLALPERLLAPLLLRHDVPPPVFIVGMPRSGTTHLHNLLALDPQFRSPRNYEVFNPFGFLTGWLSTALLTPFLTWRRPMDAVQMTVVSAQEEEFALAMMGAPSPYWSFCLPREIERHDRYWLSAGFDDQELAAWRRRYTHFLRKITVRWPWSRRRRTPLLKNPANTGRVALLRTMFPRAKFVHIVRHPHATWRSNQRLAEHGLAVFQVQDPLTEDNYATRSLGNYRRLMDAYYRETADLAPSDAVDVRYEDLEQAPEETVARIYQQLGIEPSPEFTGRLADYLEGVRGYRKNRFATLPPADQAEIDRVMAPYLAKWGYSAPAARAA